MSSAQLIAGPKVEFDNVALKIGSTQILTDLSFTVEPGNIHCLIGPNGGGKTSAIRTLLGETPHTGTISITWNGGCTIGYVPQKLDFDYNLPINVEDLMTILCQNRPAFLGAGKKKWALFEPLLDKVGMLDKRKRLMGELSGGERQRVILAQAMIPEPDLLILDEPTTGLDKDGAAVFDRIIKDMSDKGVTILWVHHDLREVREMADKVTCINKSAIFSGKPKEMLTEEKLFDIFTAPARKVEASV